MLTRSAAKKMAIPQNSTTAASAAAVPDDDGSSVNDGCNNAKSDRDSDYEPYTKKKCLKRTRPRRSQETNNIEPSVVNISLSIQINGESPNSSAITIPITIKDLKQLQNTTISPVVLSTSNKSINSPCCPYNCKDNQPINQHHRSSISGNKKKPVFDLIYSDDDNDIVFTSSYEIKSPRTEKAKQQSRIVQNKIQKGNDNSNNGPSNKKQDKTVTDPSAVQTNSAGKVNGNVASNRSTHSKLSVCDGSFLFDSCSEKTNSLIGHHLSESKDCSPDIDLHNSSSNCSSSSRNSSDSKCRSGTKTLDSCSTNGKKRLEFETDDENEDVLNRNCKSGKSDDIALPSGNEKVSDAEAKENGLCHSPNNKGMIDDDKSAESDVEASGSESDKEPSDFPDYVDITSCSDSEDEAIPNSIPPAQENTIAITSCPSMKKRKEKNSQVNLVESVSKESEKKTSEKQESSLELEKKVVNENGIENILKKEVSELESDCNSDDSSIRDNESTTSTIKIEGLDIQKEKVRIKSEGICLNSLGNSDSDAKSDKSFNHLQVDNKHKTSRHSDRVVNEVKIGIHNKVESISSKNDFFSKTEKETLLKKNILKKKSKKKLSNKIQTATNHKVNDENVLDNKKEHNNAPEIIHEESDSQAWIESHLRQIKSKFEIPGSEDKPKQKMKKSFKGKRRFVDKGSETEKESTSKTQKSDPAEKQPIEKSTSDLPPLPDDVIEKLTESKPFEKIRKTIKKSKKSSQQSPRLKKKMKMNFGEDYIPLNSSGSTKFSVASLEKLEIPVSSEVQNFKQKMLFCNRVKRISYAQHQGNKLKSKMSQK